MPKHLPGYRSHREQPYPGTPKPSSRWEKILIDSTRMASLALVQDSSLGGRVRNILKPAANRKAAPKTGAVALSAGLLLAAATVGGLAELPEPTETTSLGAFSNTTTFETLKGPLEIYSDWAGKNQQGEFSFVGHVVLTTTNTVLTADQIVFNQSTRTIVAQGHAIFTQGQNTCTTLEPAATIILYTDTGSMSAKGKHKTVMAAQPAKPAEALQKK